MRAQSVRWHALVSFIQPGAPVEYYRRFACEGGVHRDFIQIGTKVRVGIRGGAGMFIPGEVSSKLGGWCEDYGLWGFDDIDYIDRADLIHWNWGYTLSVQNETLAQGDQTMKVEHTARYGPVYLANVAEYRAGTKSLYVPVPGQKGN